MADRSENDTSKHPYLQRLGDIFAPEEAAPGKRRKGIGGGATRGAEEEEEEEEEEGARRRAPGQWRP